MNYYNIGLKTYEKLGMPSEIAQVQNNLAGAYLQMGKQDEALGYYQMALNPLQGLEDVANRE